VARKKRGKTEEAKGFAQQPDRPRLTPVDVQQHVFRLAFRGYNERDVDEFLDQVTEDLAALHEENKRLREQLEEGGTGTGPSTAAAQRQAEAIVRQAREHAAKLTASAGGGGGGELPSTFLLEERQFLQKIASLVQGHAGWLKEEARRARRSARAPRDQVAEPVAEPEPVEVTAEAAAGSGRSSVDEPTAAWSPEPSELSDDKDPLVSAWESAWAPDEPPRPANAKTKREGEAGEPSLRELFWGEE
jgi:DivIVA domain-containing protein